MSDNILSEMATEYESGAHRSNAEAMRAALLLLADYFDAQPYDPMDLWSPSRVTATALRKAAGGKE